MEAISTIDFENRNFLKRAIRFCEQIHNYEMILGLDAIKVQAFISNKMVLDFAFKNKDAFKEFSENSMPYNIETLKTSFNDLIEACKKSHNYTKSIGTLLGLEEAATGSFSN